MILSYDIKILDWNMKKNRSIDLKCVVVEITLVTIGILLAIGVKWIFKIKLIDVKI